MESTINIKLDFSGLKSIIDACDTLDTTVVRSGVLGGDAQTIGKAFLNEYGGETVYDSGPFAGEKVLVPPRSFIRYPAEHTAKKAFKKAKDILSNGLTRANAQIAIEIVGQEIEEAQRKALDTNGSDVPGWVKHNDPRTVATKGFDRPLWSRRGETFPISHEVVKK